MSAESLPIRENSFYSWFKKNYCSQITPDLAFGRLGICDYGVMMKKGE